MNESFSQEDKDKVLAGLMEKINSLKFGDFPMSWFSNNSVTEV